MTAWRDCVRTRFTCKKTWCVALWFFNHQSWAKRISNTKYKNIGNSNIWIIKYKILAMSIWNTKIQVISCISNRKIWIFCIWNNFCSALSNIQLFRKTHRWRIPGIAADTAFPFVPLPLPGEAAAIALVVVVIVRCVEAVPPHGGPRGWLYQSSMGRGSSND